MDDSSLRDPTRACVSTVVSFTPALGRWSTMPSNATPSGADLAENGGAGSAASSSGRAVRITEEAKAELRALFERKLSSWPSQCLPMKGKDSELDTVIQKHGLHRNQATRQLHQHKQSKGLDGFSFSAPSKELKLIFWHGSAVLTTL